MRISAIQNLLCFFEHVAKHSVHALYGVYEIDHIVKIYILLSNLYTLYNIHLQHTRTRTDTHVIDIITTIASTSKK